MAHFALPLVSCVWSSGDDDSLDYPARHLFAFLEHHGMLSVSGSPTWRTVVGGSATYVDALATRLGDVRTSAPVTSVTRHPDGVDVRTAAGVTSFDRAVVATHADQALALLADGPRDVVLASRPGRDPVPVESALVSAGATSVRTVPFDADDLGQHQQVLDDALDGLDPAVRAALEEAIRRVREASAAQIPPVRVTELGAGARVGRSRSARSPCSVVG